MRLRLDRPSEGESAGSPDDFIIHPGEAPAAAPQEQETPHPPAGPEAPSEEPPPTYGQPIENLPLDFDFVPLDISDPQDHLIDEAAQWDGEAAYDSQPLPDPSPPAAVPADEEPHSAAFAPAPTPGEVEPLGELDFDGGHAASSLPPAPPAESEWPVEEPTAGTAHDPGPGLESGSFEHLFAESPSAPAWHREGASDPATRREEVHPDGAEFLSAPGETQGAADATYAPDGGPASVAAASRSRGSDVDEMLGILDRESSGMAASTKIILIALVVVSLIAVGAAYFLARSLGFLSSDDRPSATPASIVRADYDTTGERAQIPETSAAAESDPSYDALLDPPAAVRPSYAEDRVSEAATAAPAPSGSEAGSALSSSAFDDRVQALVGDPSLNPDARRSGSLIGSGPSLDPIVDEPTDFSGIASTQLSADRPADALGQAPAPPSTADDAGAISFSSPTDEPTAAERSSEPGIETAAAPGAAASASRRNYNPPESFPAPQPGDGPLGKTHDLLDAFLRAPDLETRLRFSYQGESLRAAMEDYHRSRPFVSADRFSKKLFQIDDNPESGGPYWVYLISSSDAEEGFPVIIRVEDGLLKVDWDVYAEFQDRHFGQFLGGSVGSTGTFRVVLDRKSAYYGPDQDTFPDLDRYFVYQINPPYGDLDEYSKYAFVEKDSDVGRTLNDVLGLGDDPLAVILTLEIRTFPHGARHLVITDYVTEGWFR